MKALSIRQPWAWLIVNGLSPWFFGKFGFELADAKPLPFFMPCKGQLGFFNMDCWEVFND